MSFSSGGLEWKSRKTLGVTSKFGFGVQNKTGKRLIEFCQENALAIANTLFSNTRDNCIHKHHQMAKNEIRLIMFFAAKDGKALYNQQKQDLDLTVTQIMSSLSPN